ncbi:MAG: 30S ribosomal protein S8e [Candidatus Nanohaloarchaea archaeon]|nr:30S ribosomal protein S8e [Candidatus Nanohaloarchaea archaeon]
MAVVHGDSDRKKSGGRTRPHSKLKKRNLGGEFAATKLDETKTKRRDSRGETEKIALRSTDTVNVAKDGEVVSAEIESVLENDANPDYVRRNIITKGTVLQTSEGKARVTSRPGQEGVLNAVAVEE